MPLSTIREHAGDVKSNISELQTAVRFNDFCECFKTEMDARCIVRKAQQIALEQEKGHQRRRAAVSSGAAPLENPRGDSMTHHPLTTAAVEKHEALTNLDPPRATKARSGQSARSTSSAGSGKTGVSNTSTSSAGIVFDCANNLDASVRNCMDKVYQALGGSDDTDEGLCSSYFEDPERVKHNLLRAHQKFNGGQISARCARSYRDACALNQSRRNLPITTKSTFPKHADLVDAIQQFDIAPLNNGGRLSLLKRDQLKNIFILTWEAVVTRLSEEDLQAVENAIMPSF